MEDKGAAEKTGTKEGMTRGDNIPDDTFVGVATGTGAELDEEVDGKNPAAAEEDQGWRLPCASKWAARVAREEPWPEMAGRPWEAEWAPTTADNDCCTIAEIGVWMAWITWARNSGDKEALVGGRDACTDVRTALVETETADGGAEETAGGTALSKLFLVRRGGITVHETAMKWKGTRSENTRAVLNEQQTNKSAKK